MLTQDQLERITESLDARFGLDTLWLYGSEAEGTARPDSDVDLAALFRRRPEGLELFDARTELEEILRRDVDLVDLDQAPPPLGRQGLKHGCLLVDRNPGRRHDAFSRILNLYEDVRILRREGEQAMLERMRVG
ncbi:MAG TPA: nucleotidyltransferase domain-containing protein [Thermoanaerobaculia bacterium]|nr:nucleotidyltransferase domain-containing protein [Thermoanaerobaculia bacterium]